MNFEYAAAPESRSVVKIDPVYGHFINGKWVNGSAHFNSINPATEEVLSRIALGWALCRAGKPEEALALLEGHNNGKKLSRWTYFVFCKRF